jgi:hypothetical protein
MGPPVAEVETTTASVEPLAPLVERTLRKNLDGRLLSTRRNGAWQILHGVLAYGDQLRIDTPDGLRSAVDYLLDGGPLDGFQPLAGDRLGNPPRPGLRMEMQPTTKIGQGHRDQWLAILAQTDLPAETPIRSAAGTFTVEDWVRQTEYDVSRNLEYEFSWTLIALTAYRDTTHRWQSRDGFEYGIEQLLRSEIEQDLAASVCGGTHRLIGIAMTLNRRRAEGKPITGVWAEAADQVDRAIDLARSNQNPDGSYSIAYLHRTGWTRDLGERLGTTGHVLEFLALSAPDETLRQPWVERTVRHLCRLLEECRDVDLECGVLYHALHGLAEYQSRLKAAPHNASAGLVSAPRTAG